MPLTVLPLSPFPTSAPVALGGSTPSVNLAAPRGLISGKSTSGSAVVRLLVWNAALSAWDVPVVQGQQISIVPDSTIPGGVDQVEFDVATPAYFAAQLTTAPPENDIANLTVDIGLAPGALATGVARIFSIAPAAGGLVVHAAVAGTAANVFPGPFTNPDIPRNLRVSAGVGYDGGAVTVTGTDQFDAVITEVFSSPVGGQNGVKAFKTVTGASKAAVGVDPATVSIVTPALAADNKYGVPFAIAGAYAVGQLQSTAAGQVTAINQTYNTIAFTTLDPDGTRRFNAVIQG